MATNGALGRLNIALGLDSAEFTRGLSKAEYVSKQSMDKIAATAAIAGAAIASAFTAAAATMAVLAKQSIDNMDAMSKLAASSGIAIDSLTSLGYAGDLSGVSIETLGANMVKLTKNMSDAAKGTGDAKDAFAAMGLSVHDAEGNLKSANAMLGDIAERFASYKDGAEKTALAVGIFGRAGAQMIPMLNAGKEGLAAAQAEADRLGITLSKDAASAAEAFNDNLSRLHATQDGWINAVTAEVLPALNQFAEFAFKVSSQTDDVRESVKSLADFVGLHEWLDSVGLKMATTMDELDVLYKAVNVLVASFEGMFANVSAFLASTTRDDTGIAAYFSPEAAKKHNDQLDAEFARRNKTLSDGTKTLRELVGGNNRVYRDMWIGSRTPDAAMLDSIQVTAPSIGGKGKGGGKGAGKAAKDIDYLGLLIKSDDIQIAMTDLQKYYDFLDNVTGQAVIKQHQQQKAWLDGALDIGTITYEEYEKALDKIAIKGEKTMSQLDEFTLQAARNIQDSLGDGLYSLLSGNFDDIGQKFADTLLRMAADAAAANLAGAMFGDYGKTGQIGGIIGNIAGAVFGGGSAPAGVTPGVDWTFASGGYTGPGGKYEPAGIVHRGEYVLNQEATRRIGVGTLERMNKGYANGGLVGGTTNSPAMSDASGGNVAVSVTIQSDGRSDTQSTAGYEDFAKDIGDYINSRFRELEMRSHKQGGQAWAARNGRV